MLTRQTMKGLYVLTVTPFDDKLRLDEEAYRENVRKLLDAGADGIITSGTNGEFHTTSDEERQKIARIVVEETRGRAAAVIGASGVNTAESIARTRAARDAGADAVMNLLPFYLAVTKKEAYEYFEDLYAACPDIGVISYNNPGTTKVLLTDEDYLRIQQVPNVCGTKMIGSDMFFYLNCLRRTEIRHFPLEQLWSLSHVVGGNGVMASFIYAFPGYMMRWWEAIRSGSAGTALAMQHEVNALLQSLVLPLILVEGLSEISATKMVIDAAGELRAGPARKPFRSATPERIRKLRADIERQFPQFLDARPAEAAAAHDDR